MPNDQKSGKDRAPALDDVKTEREADAAARAKDADAKSGPTDSVPAHSGDSPKPHGDKMEHAVREAAGKPSGKKG
jgi:hypothetical protein